MDTGEKRRVPVESRYDGLLRGDRLCFISLLFLAKMMAIRTIATKMAVWDVSVQIRQQTPSHDACSSTHQ